MTALLLVIGLFLVLTFVGQATIALIRPRLGVLWSWFIAPTVGMAILIVLLTRLNVWGIPVATAGPWLAIGLGVFTVGVFIWRRPTLPWKQLLPFFAIVCLYLVYTGWPALRFGFNWISYGNDDMANYCLAADRFLHNGYYDLPLQTDLEGMNYSQHYWFMHALQQIRPGSELVVAWLASLTRLKAHEVFMPAILMLSMIQIFALGAVGLYKGRYRKVVFISLVLFATSPLFGLGTLYQLIAQVAGIANLLAISSLVLTTRFMTGRKMVLTAVLTGCLGILYPEVSPFVALSILLFTARMLLVNRAQTWPYVKWVLGVAVLTFVFIGSNTYQFINTLVMQSTGAAGLGAMAEINDQSGGLVLFPWTLVPSFIPMLVGLHPFGVVGVDPLISIQIIVGALVLLYLLARTWRNLLADSPIGYIAAVMFPLGLYLFIKGQDFGLFKLAMFAQPVVTLTLAQGFAALIYSHRRKLGLWIAAIYLGCTIPSHLYYSHASLGTYGGGLTEVVDASRLGVAFTPPNDLKYDGIESDISNVVSAKMLAQYTQGIDTRFLSRSYMDNIANIAVLKFLREPNPDLGPQARLMEKLAMLRFMLPDELMKGDVPDYRVMSIQKLDNNWTETSSRHLRYHDRLFVSVVTELDHFNKLNPGEGWTVQNMYQYKLESQVKDRLVFTHSELSPHYYSSARFKAAFFQREPEPIFSGDVYFHGTGRFTTFQIINPSPDLRVVVDFTRTSLGEGRAELPTSARVIGEEDYALPFVGAGSARVFSPIIKPEYYEKQAYITIDFNDRPGTIAKPKTGLMRLYGEKFHLDDRRLVGFTRDISVMTDEQYRKLPRPMVVNRFPEDLSLYPGFEYSGIFEDGWVSKDAYFKLGASRPGQVFSFKGTIPETELNEKNGVDLTISLNGEPTEVVHLTPGDFELTRLIKEAVPVTTISLHFSSAGPYAKDIRNLSAAVRELAIIDAPGAEAFAKITNDEGQTLAWGGVDKDGWIGAETNIGVPATSRFKVLRIDLEMPGWSPLEHIDLTVTKDGAAVDSIRVPRTSFHSVYVPIPPGKGQTVTLKAAQTFPLPGEGRQRSFLIKNVGLENLSSTDVFAHGWHDSGYVFGIHNIDTDGWVEHTLDLSFPATTRFTRAHVRLVRFPGEVDMPLEVTVDGVESTRTLGFEKAETITVPLSASSEVKASLTATKAYTLGPNDPRQRSYRVISVDFE